MPDQLRLLCNVLQLIESNDFEALHNLLEDQQNIETVSLPFPPPEVDGKRLYPAIHAAVKSKNLSMIKILHDYDESFIRQSGKHDVEDDCFCWLDGAAGLNPLHLASMLGYARVAVTLLALGMDPHSRASKIAESIYKSYSALHLAAFHGHLHIFQTYLYYFQHREELRPYITQALNSESGTVNLDRLPPTFVFDSAEQQRHTYDQEGNFLPEDPDNTQTQIERPQISPREGFIGELSLEWSVDVFNTLINKKTMEKDSVLHVATYHRKTSIIDFILRLALSVNTAFLMEFAPTPKDSDDMYPSASIQSRDHSDEDRDSDDEDHPTLASQTRQNHPFRLSVTQKKKKLIQLEGLDAHGNSAVMIAASRGFSDILALFCNYNELILKKIVAKTLETAKSYLNVWINFGRCADSRGDTILHLACQSQLHRVFNYNYELQEDHYGCIYQLVSRMSMHGIDLEAKNREGDKPLDLLLEPAADLFEALYWISRGLCQANIAPSITDYYPTIRSFLDACAQGKSGPHFAPFMALMHQLTEKSESFTEECTANKLPAPSYNTIASYLNLDKLLSLADKLNHCLANQKLVDEDRQHSCKRLDTNQIPHTRKFKHYDRNVASSSNESSNSSTSNEITMPAGHPDISLSSSSSSLAKEGATCPMGFGPKRKVPTAAPVNLSYSQDNDMHQQMTSSSSVTGDASTSSPSLSSVPSGHPDISSATPGAVCPMGFGRRKAPSSEQLDSTHSSNAADGTSTTADVASNSNSSSNISSTDKSETLGHHHLQHLHRASHKRAAGLLAYLNYDTLLIIGTVGILASFAAFRYLSSSNSGLRK